MSAQRDGRFYAEGRDVRRAPLEKEVEGGRAITMGFRVCQVDEWVSREAAQEIADALNAALDAGKIT